MDRIEMVQEYVDRILQSIDENAVISIYMV